MSKECLVLLPHAGGSSFAYQKFMEHLLPDLYTIAIDYPGHGRNIHKKLVTEINDLTENVFSQLKKIIARDKTSYSLFGHSMGALISYLLCHRIQKEGFPTPKRIFVSGRPGPSYSKNLLKSEKQINNLSSEKFMEDIVKMGGSPAEIKTDPVLSAFFEPILRSDFIAVSKFEYESRTPLNLPMTIFYGTNEAFGKNGAMLWQLETTLPINLHSFNGGHFFLFDHILEISTIIKNNILHS